MTEVAPTSTRVNGRTVMKVEGEILDVPGGRFVWHGFAVVPPGTQVNVAYDPGEPDDAVVLDDLKKVASSAIVREAAAQRDRADVMLDRLAQLERLRGSGSLTEAEFDRLKAEIIGDAR
ncbi:hypothetical protein [Thermocatellispora tengchongensis]|uniref:hypothetical protein n=1 Tax=Thermocatellispora tengchongensis TaxID=1073253 RepID=UPI003633BBEA